MMRSYALVALLGLGGCSKLVGADFDLPHPPSSVVAGAAVPLKLVAHLTTPRPQQTSSQFGFTLALDEKSLVVTAPFEDIETGAGFIDAGGAAYVFDRQNLNTPPVWLVPLDVHAGDGIFRGPLEPPGSVFGDVGSLRAALNDDVIAIGAPAEPVRSASDPTADSGSGAGAIHVYNRAELSSPFQTIHAPQPGTGVIFGECLSLSATRLAVGAPFESTDIPFGGAVYVYDWRDGRFDDAHAVRIVPDIKHDQDFFGFSVAIDGDLLVVGAPGESSKSTGLNGDPTDTSLTGNGAVYVYRFDGEHWVLEQYVKPGVAQANGYFGLGLSLNAGRFAVGAPFASGCPDDATGPTHGTAYVVEGADGGGWEIASCLSLGAVSEALHGWSLALVDDLLVVGAPWDPSGHAHDENDSSRRFSGAAHLYARSAAGRWSEKAYIKAPDIERTTSSGSPSPSRTARSPWAHRKKRAVRTARTRVTTRERLTFTRCRLRWTARVHEARYLSGTAPTSQKMSAVDASFIAASTRGRTRRGPRRWACPAYRRARY